MFLFGFRRKDFVKNVMNERKRDKTRKKRLNKRCPIVEHRPLMRRNAEKSNVNSISVTSNVFV